MNDKNFDEFFSKLMLLGFRADSHYKGVYTLNKPQISVYAPTRYSNKSEIRIFIEGGGNWMYSLENTNKAINKILELMYE